MTLGVPIFCPIQLSKLTSTYKIDDAQTHNGIITHHCRHIHPLSIENISFMFVIDNTKINYQYHIHKLYSSITVGELGIFFSKAYALHHTRHHLWVLRIRWCYSFYFLLRKVACKAIFMLFLSKVIVTM